jgi:hypothetical protein
MRSAHVHDAGADTKIWEIAAAWAGMDEVEKEY